MNATEKAMFFVRWNWGLQYCLKLIRGQVDDE